MTQELAIELQCVVINGGIEKWLEKDKAQMVSAAVKRGDKFVEIGGELINTFAVSGVYNAQTMADKTRRMNGEWQCRHGVWYGKGQTRCECSTSMDVEEKKRIEEETRKKYGITD